MIFDELIKENYKSIAIAGHVHPDGDCAGSVMGAYHYLSENFPGVSVTPYLEILPDYLSFLTENEEVRSDEGSDKVYDLMIILDAASFDRIGAGKEAFQKAKHRICIDHHETNTHFAEEVYVKPLISSTAEFLTEIFTTEKISKKTAECLYTGIIHDTGVFRYTSADAGTLRQAAVLLEKGINAAKIIEVSITNRPMKEMKITSEIIMDSYLTPEKLLVGKAPIELIRKYDMKPSDLGNVVAELNACRECEFVLFAYQYEDLTWKGSLRTKNDDINLAEISKVYGGGGHKKAAGFSFAIDPDKVATEVSEMIREQLKDKA